MATYTPHQHHYGVGGTKKVALGALLLCFLAALSPTSCTARSVVPLSLYERQQTISNSSISSTSTTATPTSTTLVGSVTPSPTTQTNSTSPNSIPLIPACNLNQSQPPAVNLSVSCGNASLFHIWRPKARFIAPEGWMNDPMAMWQRSNGSFHAGYQYHPQHIQWGNISMGGASSEDLVYWKDIGGWENAKRLWPSQIYDIRGVFDGTIIPAALGFNSSPTLLYTSTNPGGPLGATVNETQGTETQSIAYTPDEGESWIKLDWGSTGNPVISEWPETNLTGFRDPYVFSSPYLTKLLANTSSILPPTPLKESVAMAPANSSTNTTASGERLFATISGGQHGVGPMLFLYRQVESLNVVDWEYLGVFTSRTSLESWSEYSGNFGINFETAAVTRLNATGQAFDDGSDTTATDILMYGTEQGRNGSHENHWPLWTAVKYAVTNGSVSADVLYSGVIDWGHSYAFVSFPVKPTRQVLVGWTYEDDETLQLAKQQGYQGAFTLFRDLYMKVTENVDPTTPGLNANQSSWLVTPATNASSNSTTMGVTVTTLGQRVIPEITSAYKSASKVTTPQTGAVPFGYTPFSTQPSGRHYALTGTFTFALNETTAAGFSVLSSVDSKTLNNSVPEHTDIYYDPVNETLVVDRTTSSLVRTYGFDPEYAKLKLFPQLGATTKELNLTVYVDNSVVEIYANDEAVITTRAYPWLSASIGAGYLAQQNTSSMAAAANGTNSLIQASNVELWDGLINAWPSRPANTSRGLVWDGPAATEYGLWAGY